VVTIPGVDRPAEAVSVALADLAGRTIEALDVVGMEKLALVDAAFHGGRPAQFLGTSLLVPTVTARRVDLSRRQFVFAIADVRPADDPMDLLGATPEEVLAAATNVQTQFPGGVAKAMYDGFVAAVGIVGEHGTALADALEAVQLQACSCGYVMHSPGRLHILLVGPPGHGKKLASVFAETLNPTFEIVSPSRCTPAGLVGPAVRVAGGWSSEPGVLARAADGVVCMQDAHDWPLRQVRDIAPLLYQWMEDGNVAGAGVAGGHGYATSAALLIDANRAEHAFRGRVKEIPILGLVPLLSRVDVIIEVPVDLDHAFGVGGQMLGGLAQSNERSLSPAFVRKMRLAVATLRKRHPVIDLDPVRVALAARYAALRADNAELFATSPMLVASMARRLVVQMGRLVAASARANDRSVATEHDVTVAMRMVQRKLEFLRLASVRLSDCPPADKMRREEWLVGEFGGQQVQTEDLIIAWEEQTGERVDERTMRRSLRDVDAARKGRGLYEVPASVRTSGQTDSGR